MPYLETSDSTEIYYTDWGTGTPVVLIHGWPFTSDMWERQANYLAENGSRVICYDRRGFGRSEQTWDGYDYNTLAGDLNDLMEALDLRAATLVGFSMGGGEVVRYLSKFGQQRVAKAVLISAVPPFLLKTPDNPEGVESKVFEDIEKNVLKDRPAFLHSFAQKFFGRTTLNHTVSDQVLDWSVSMGMTGSLRSTLQTAIAWSTTDFRQEMRALDLPVRIIHGTSDATVPLEVSGARSAKLLPDATLSEYNGEPHGLFLTAADRLNEELLEFISGADTLIRGTEEEVVHVGNYATSVGQL